MGFISATVPENPTISSETMATGTYPLVITGSTSTNVWSPTNTLPPNNRGLVLLSRTHTVTIAGRKLTFHGGLPHVFNSRSGVGTPNVESLTLALFVNGVCCRAISMALVPGNYSSFAQIAATVVGNPGTHIIELKLMVHAAASSFTVGGAYGSAGNPYLIVRESS